MKKMLAFFVLLFCYGAVFAHSPLLSVEANSDGTLYVEGGFSNGSSAAGVKLYLKDKETGEVLWEGVFPENGSIILPIPNAPYTVTFDGGPGHLITKDGPEPPNGFGTGAESGASAEDSGSESSESENSVDGNSEESGENTAEENGAEAGGEVQEEEENIETLPVISAAWSPVDTMQAVPQTGVSFIALLTLILSVFNLILMIFILKKKFKK